MKKLDLMDIKTKVMKPFTFQLRNYTTFVKQTPETMTCQFV